MKSFLTSHVSRKVSLLCSQGKEILVLITNVSSTSFENLTLD